MLHTTLKLCKANDACVDGYKTLKKSLPNSHKDTDLIPLTHILESNSLDDCLWALRATVEDSEKLSRSFAIWCARQVLPIWQQRYPDDDRVKNCIDIAEKFNNGEATEEEMIAAKSTVESAVVSSYRSAAHNAARTSAFSAEGAAWSAATSAVRSAVDSPYRAGRGAALIAATSAQKEKLIKMLETHSNGIINK